MVVEPTRLTESAMANPEQAAVAHAGDVIRPGAHERRGTGLKVNRAFTKPGQDPYSTIEWTRRTSRITNPDGSVVFEMADAEVPASWSQVATDIMVSKYFRKAGVPQLDEQGNPLLDETAARCSARSARPGR